MTEKYRHHDISDVPMLEIDLPNEASDEDLLEDNEFDDDGDEIFAEPTECLFCEQISIDIENAISHLKSVHNIDFKTLKRKFKMDQYDYIKLINFIRSENVESKMIQLTEEKLWNDDKYLKPGKYEPWLTYDFESIESDCHEESIEEVSSESQLKEIIRKLKEEINQKNDMLQNAVESIEKMRKGFRFIMEKDAKSSKSDCTSIAELTLKEDESYFNSYAHFSIHHEMLSDSVRTESYRDAILKNKIFLNGKQVLDVGCGTSILSMLAAKAGAGNVIAIDNSEIIYKAMDIARNNNFDTIQFIKGRLEDTELPVDKFDVIISEWMGYFLIFEGMLDSIIYARNRHLKSGGTLMPNRCTINMAALSDYEMYKKYIMFWNNVYEFDMSPMKDEVLQEAMITICNPDSILTNYCVLVDYNLYEINLNYCNFECNFKLDCNRTDTVYGFVAHFDTFFDLPSKVWFSTSCESKPTHWKQVVFFLKDPVKCHKDDLIEGKFICKRSKKDLRSIDVTIYVFNKKYSYFLN